MRHLFPVFACTFALLGCISSEEKAAMKEKARTEIEIENIIRSLTLEEKVHLVMGLSAGAMEGDKAMIDSIKHAYPGYAGATYPIPRLGIPSLLLCDGPAGLRIDNVKATNEVKDYWCTSFPIGSLLASTWNNDVLEYVGKAIGEETREYGVDVILGPGMNIHRHPLAGRNYEYFSEDPYLSGMIAAAYVKGVQSEGVGTSIKHFAVNNQETSRLSNDAMVSQRALREIYLRNFEYTVRNSEPWTVMTSYNFINDVHSSENPELVTNILKDEWGFDGVAVTDWGGGYDSAAQIAAGQDMIQSGKGWRYDQIVSAIKDGNLSEKALDNSVRNVLKLVYKSYKYKWTNGEAPKYSGKPDLDAHNRVAREVSTEGMVLLKNDNNCLPLSGKNVALFGATSYNLIAGGLGAGDVNSKYVKTLPQAFTDLGFNVDRDVQAVYEKSIAEYKKFMAENPKPKQARRILPSEPELTQKILDIASSKADVAVVTFGRITGEWNDALTESFSLYPAERKLLETLRENFKKVVVVLNTGMVMETSSWKDIPDAILLAWQGGSETASAVADLLSGSVNPSGKLPVSFPCSLADVPSDNNFPHDWMGEVNVAPWKDEDGQLKDVHYTDYAEGIYVGYRHYVTAGVPVSYPFGYGLSYTDFEFSGFSVENDGKTTVVKVDVKNVGKVAGKQVAEVYVKAAPSKNYDKPARELKAYAKTGLLAPGESQTLVMCINNSDLASFDEDGSAWVVDKGEYEFMLGTDVNSIVASQKVNVSAGKRKVDNVLKKRPHTPRHLEYRG